MNIYMLFFNQNDMAGSGTATNESGGEREAPSPPPETTATTAPPTASLQCCQIPSKRCFSLALMHSMEFHGSARHLALFGGMRGHDSNQHQQHAPAPT